jgi:hypothetical protein
MLVWDCCGKTMWRSSCLDSELDALHTSGIKSIVKGALTGKPGYKDAKQAQMMYVQWKGDWENLIKFDKKCLSKEMKDNNQKMMQKLEDNMNHSQDYIDDKKHASKAKAERIERRNDVRFWHANEKEKFRTEDTDSPFFDDELSTSVRFYNPFRRGPKLGNEDEDRRRYLEWKNDYNNLANVNYVTDLMKNNKKDMTSFLIQNIQAAEKKYPQFLEPPSFPVANPHVDTYVPENKAPNPQKKAPNPKKKAPVVTYVPKHKAPVVTYIAENNAPVDTHDPKNNAPVDTYDPKKQRKGSALDRVEETDEDFEGYDSDEKSDSDEKHGRTADSSRLTRSQSMQGSSARNSSLKRTNTQSRFPVGSWA